MTNNNDWAKFGEVFDMIPELGLPADYAVSGVAKEVSQKDIADALSKIFLEALQNINDDD